MKHYTCFVLVTLMLIVSLGASASSLVSQGLGAAAYSCCVGYPGQVLELAFDGNLATGHVSGDPWDFIQVDLGQTILLDRADMYTWQVLDRVVEIYISDTTMIVDSSPVVGAPVYSQPVVTAGLPNPSASFEFAEGTTARYVAFNAVNVAYTDWLEWTEFQVYGDVVPEPSGLVALMAGALGVFGYVRRRK